MVNLDLGSARRDTDEIATWREGRERAREPVASTLFTAGSAAAFFILAACVVSAVIAYYQGH
ncbi:MAG: hypothetical protein JSR86_03690 [Proteobacteria bacterium]|nr:hypothetical protein [Pseudomonadota bacterium]